MKTFLIDYSFDGYGTARVEAKNKEEARKKFDCGDWYEVDEEGEKYIIDEINEDED